MKEKKYKNEFKIVIKLKIKNIRNRINLLMLKIKNVWIILKSSCNALLKVFKSKLNMENDIYVSLVPTNKADEDGTYCRALKYAIDNDEIKNIAITGNYGSGKSSVIKTFFDKIENKKYNPIYVSLAAFNKDDYIIKNKNDKGKNAKGLLTKNEFYHTLEKSILQQILYQTSEKKVPLSRFRRITKHSKLLLGLMSIGVICSIIIVVLIMSPKIVNNIVTNYNIIINLIPKCVINILIGILILVVYQLIYKLIFLLSNKINVTRFKIKDTEVDINDKPESIFNKYLDEIIYFFQVTNYQVVVIEDLDRYEGDASFIFQKLRELNTLINSSNQINYKIDFIYAIKDDFFKNYEERTKFFDYIIPIIPITSNGNSNEIIWKRLEDLKKESKIKYKFNKDFIDNISVVLEDKRLIDNVINEFIIYKNKIKNEYMDDKQLFTIIVYKNLYPEKYSLLQKDQGVIVDIFINKNTKVKELIDDLKEEKANFIEEKYQIQQEHLKTIKELKYVLVSSIYRYSEYYYEKYFMINGEKVNIDQFYQTSIDYNKIKNSNIVFYTRDKNLYEDEVFNFFGNKTLFLERWENIENGKNEELKNIQKEIENIDIKIKNISKLKLKQLIKKYDMDSLFNKTTFEEKFFITKGYITEEYKDYITLFVPGNLTKEDREFVSAVRINQVLPYDFKLKNIENILKKLNEGDFENIAILNFDLLEYLIKNQDEEKILKIVSLINEQNDTILEFVDEFNKKFYSEYFVKLLIESANTMWKKIYKKLGNEKYINGWVLLFLENEKSLRNIDENFKEYVKRHKNIDMYINNDKIENVIQSLKILNIKLENIQSIGNSEFLERVYINNLYKLNSTMIELMLKLNNIDTKEFKNRNLSLLFKLQNLKDYVLSNFKEYYNYCYTLNGSNLDGEEEIISVIKNNSVNSTIKKQIIANEKFSNYNIENIELEVIKKIIQENKMNNTYSNLLYIFKQLGENIDENIINNIKLNKEQYKKENINDYCEKYGYETINNFILMYIFNENVKIQDLKILYKSFNVKIKEIRECNDEKIKYLIEKNAFEFNENNFHYIKENIADKLIEYIYLNIKEYIENIEKCDISGYEERLLLNSNISVEDKSNIARYIDLEVLDNTTLIYLINNKIVNTDNEIINKKIINDINIKKIDKVKLVKRIIDQEFFEEDITTEYIHLLGEEYKNINTNKNGCSIKHNNENLEFCKSLKEKNFISSYKIGKKNNIILYNKFNR